nr:MAG TPA: hypothetical protein [Caudoviricetes sp.]
MGRVPLNSIFRESSYISSTYTLLEIYSDFHSEIST